MSGSFLAIALVAAVMIIYWRLTLLVLVALSIALLVTGFTWIAGVAGGPAPAQPPTSVTVPSGPAPVQMGQPH